MHTTPFSSPLSPLHLKNPHTPPLPLHPTTPQPQHTQLTPHPPFIPPPSPRRELAHEASLVGRFRKGAVWGGAP